MCENMAVMAGGCVYSYYADPLIINCTITGNGALNGGGLYCESSDPVIVNSIFWGNMADENGDQIFACTGSDPQVSYCDIQDGWTGDGNIDIAPQFRNGENGDYHLMAIECDDPLDSPCIDAGCPSLIDSLLDCDWGMGTVRSDMGAYGGGDSAAVSIATTTDYVRAQFELYPNYPNPFNLSTTINYFLPETRPVSITIYDILGRQLETLLNCSQHAGSHSIIWKAYGRTSGIYFARVSSYNQTESIMMILLK